MSELVLPLLAGVAATVFGGGLCGVAYHHVLVPLNEVLRSSMVPRYTGRRTASAVGHGCALGHAPARCSCSSRRRHTVLEYRAADMLPRRSAVPGIYPVGAELTVRVRYRDNRPFPLTRITAVRGAVTGLCVGAGLGLVHSVLVCAVVCL